MGSGGGLRFVFAGAAAGKLLLKAFDLSFLFSYGIFEFFESGRRVTSTATA